MSGPASRPHGGRGDGAARTCWTGGQYSLLRCLLGLCLLVRFLTLVPRGAESFARGGSAVARSGPADRLAVVFGVLDMSASPAVVTAALLLAAVAAMLFALGRWDRPATVLILLLGAAFVASEPEAASASWILCGWILLAHLAIPSAPYGSLAALGRADPAGVWRMPAPVPAASRVLLATAHAGSGVAMLWAGTTGAAGAGGIGSSAGIALGGIEIALALLLFPPVTRRWSWTSLLAVAGVMTVLGEPWGIGPGLVLLHLFSFDPAWLPHRGSEGTDRLFYDGTCGLCHRAVRFLIAEDPTGGMVCFAPLGGGTFRGAVPAATRETLPDSLVLLTPEGRLLLRSNVTVRLLDRFGGLWRPLARGLRLVPRPVRDTVYDAIAAIRYRLFARPDDSCPVVPDTLRERFDA